MCCRALLELMKQDHTPLDLVTPRAIEHAVTTVMVAGSGSNNAVLITCSVCCRALLELLKQDIKPSDIMTPEAFKNVITIVMAPGGGSTNAVHTTSVLQGLA